MKPVPDQNAPGVNRRDFSGILLGTASAAYLASLGYPVCRYLSAAAELQQEQQAVREVTLPDVANQLPLGSTLYFSFGNEPGLLIHYLDDTWAAFGAYCTHLRCTIRHQPEQDRIFCPCHEGVFDARSGQNLAGPPPRPLTRFNLTFQGGDLLISRA